MVFNATIRAAAVGGVAMVWCYFTLKTFKICEKIVFFPPEEEEPPKYRCEYCGKNFLDPEGDSRRWALGQAVHVCEDCAGLSTLISDD